MTTHRVSIGMTVDNGAAYLEAALDGLLAQTFGDFELILSDDGSTDASESICRAYAERDPRIRYYREEEHRGPFWNTNRVFELSRGEYFKWSTHDDLCAPTFLARCVELLDGDASLAWCHTLTSHIDASGRALPAGDGLGIPEAQAAFSLVATGSGLPRHTRRSTRPHERFHGVVLGPQWCSDGYGLFRSAAVRRTRLLQPYYGAGKVLIAEVALQGRFEEVPDVLFFERLRETASVDRMTAVQRKAFIGPTTPITMALSRLKLLREYVRSVRHSGLSGAEQRRCMAVLGRYFFQGDKWKRMLGRLKPRNLAMGGVSALGESQWIRSVGRIYNSPFAGAGISGNPLHVPSLPPNLIVPAFCNNLARTPCRHN